MSTTCPGCGLERPAGAWLPTKGINASAECGAVLAEVAGFEASHYARVGRLHQLFVDTYGAQHAGPATKPIRVACSVVGLHLALDRGVAGLGVRTAHTLMGRGARDWPAFPQPPTPGALTVGDLAAVRDPADYLRALPAWARSVWATWRDQHPDVVALTDRLFTGNESFWRQTESY